MSTERVLAWILYAVWATWMFGLQSWMGREAGSAWVPDLGLVLALSLLARAEASDAPLFVLVTAVARATFGAEPAIVILTGVGLVVGLALVVRSTVELGGMLPRTLVTLALVLTFHAWLHVAGAMRADDAASLHLGSFFAAWPAAFASAAMALVLGPFLAHLPGLTPIRSRRW